MMMANCSEVTKSDSDSPDVIYKIDDIPAKCISANNNFSLNLFNNVNAEDQEKNVFLSPVSASFALGMTMNGADGNTFEEMKNTLGFEDLSLDEINATYSTLIGELYNVSDGVEFNLANSIWYSIQFSLQDKFRQLNENYFNAKVEGLDFGDAENTLNTINSWVEDQTKNRIKDLVTELDPNACMFLINAIYFNATWKYQFDTENTKTGTFWIDNNQSVVCDMMTMKHYFKFAQATDYDALELPYGNENYAMLLVLPKTEDINTFISIINDSVVEDIIETLGEDSVNIFIPKLEIEYEKELNNVLQTMGISQAFEQSANFSKMFNEMESGIWIEKVKQKSFLKVNEEGTEAAAATAVQMNFESVSDEIFLTFNRPFIFFILEKRTNTILFCGKIMNPVEEN
jgi:serpin B